MTLKQKIMAITFPLTIFLYLSICLFGKEFGAENKIWLQSLPVFLLIPLMPFFLGYWKLKFSVPLVITIIYVVIGAVSQSLDHPLWHPAWVIFILIPIIQVLIKPTKVKSSVKFEYHNDDN